METYRMISDDGVVCALSMLTGRWRRRVIAAVMCSAFLSVFIVGTTRLSVAAAEDRLESIHKQATDLKAAGNWEHVENLRLERRTVIADSSEHTPWEAGLEAIKNAADMVDKLRYREACDELRKAWAPFASQPTGPVFGDIAMRMFEVAQQGLAIYREALTDGSPDQVASVAELRTALELAIARDPCSTEAVAMLAFITAPAPEEAFLRAEVRPTLKRRNNDMLNIAWRSGAVLPWHASVELEKAHNSLAILRDLQYRDFLTPDLKDADGSIRSGHVFKGIDGKFAPFQIMYGRFILMEITDSAGRLRPAMVYLTPRGEWSKKHLQLLWRTPTEEEEKNEQVAKYVRFFRQLKPSLTWELGRSQFSLFDLPIEAAQELADDDIKNIAIKRAETLAIGKLSLANNDPKFLVSKLGVPTHPAVYDAVNSFERRGDRTKHALLALTAPSGEKVDNPSANSGYFNPLLVMSDDDKLRPQPAFFRNGQGEPFLRLSDGNSLVFVDSDPQQLEFQVRFPGVTGHIPLFIDAIPGMLIQATPAGRVLTDLLGDAKYTESQSLDEIRRSFTDPDYIPAKFGAILKARAASQKRGVAEVATELLREKGWKESSSMPGDDLRARYSLFGFRYLTDARRNLVTHPVLTMSLAPSAEEKSAVERNLPFDFRLQDGKKAVDTTQLYTTHDYDELTRNIATEFLPNMIARHPCLPSLGIVLRFLAKTDVDKVTVSFPTAPFPEWMADEDKEVQGQLNRLFIEYARALLPAASENAAASSKRNRSESLRYFIAMQLQAARDLAVKKYFHQSLVFYNDLVDMAELLENDTLDDQARELVREGYDRGALRQMEDLFLKAPTKERIDSFARLLNHRLRSQRLPILLEIEQAAVLRAAGLEKSADFLWRRIVDQYRLYTLPLIELSVDYARSLGFDPSAGLEASEREIAGYLDAIKAAAGSVLEDREYVTEAVRAGKDDPRAATAVADLISVLGEDGRAKQVDTLRLDNKIAALQSMSRSAPVWAEEKILFRKKAKNYLYRGSRSDYTLAPVRICPAAYSSEDGFFVDFEDILPDDLSRQLSAWAALPAEQAAQDPSAGNFNFILGWYWLDNGNFAEAKSAFAAAARAFLAASHKGDDLPSLVARRNALMMLLALASVTQTPPGVTTVTTDFLDGLTGQALIWERTWYAKGHNGGHAARERGIVNTLLPFIRDAMQRDSTALSDRHSRYFFTDYRFRFGAVPDNLLADAIVMKLFEKFPRHPDGRPNPAVKPEDREKPGSNNREITFGEFIRLCYPLVLTVDKDIMNLGK